MWGQRLSRANTRSLSRRIRIVRPSTATTFRRSAVSSASEQTRTVARDPLPVAMMSLLSKEDIRSDQRTACAGGGLRTATGFKIHADGIVGGYVRTPHVA